MAATKKGALAAFDAFIETWGVKYDKVVECLVKNALLAFYDFPAEHWKHLLTTTHSRKLVRHHPPPNHPVERMPLEQDRARHTFKVGSREKLEAP